MADNDTTFAVRLNDEESLEALRLILRYEALLRGQSQGKTIVDLLLGSIDPAAYPPEIRARLAELLP